jgi:hypothetical protein
MGSVASDLWLRTVTQSFLFEGKVQVTRQKIDEAGKYLK